MSKSDRSTHERDVNRTNTSNDRKIIRHYTVKRPDVGASAPLVLEPAIIWNLWGLKPRQVLLIFSCARDGEGARTGKGTSFTGAEVSLDREGHEFHSCRYLLE
ncbi:MAG: hypothetical protein ACRD20_07205 [Terriglobales bacterium]